jgi:hypothetical protein
MAQLTEAWLKAGKIMSRMVRLGIYSAQHGRPNNVDLMYADKEII